MKELICLGWLKNVNAAKEEKVGVGGENMKIAEVG